MNVSFKWPAILAASCVLLTGCTSSITQKEQYSGFLPYYDNLTKVTSPSGATALRWVSPSFNSGAYSTVVFNGLELYPAPKPNERINMQTWQELQAYSSATAQGALSKHYRVVPTVGAIPPGSRTLIMRAAITEVSASNVGMKWYEIVPIAAVNAGAGVALGYRDQNAELYIEAELVDAQTKQSVAKAVRKVVGATLQNDTQVITSNDFKASIKALGDDLQVLLK